MITDSMLALARVRSLFDADLDAERVAAVDEARAEGATWEQVAQAMGVLDRRAAQKWRSRR